MENGKLQSVFNVSWFCYLFMQNVSLACSFSHPYEFELDRFTPAEEQLKKGQATPPKPMEEVPLLMIERQEQISSLVDDLRKYKSLAVDLEVSI